VTRTASRRTFGEQKSAPNSTGGDLAEKRRAARGLIEWASGEKEIKKIKMGLTVGRDALVSQSATENERLRTRDRSVQVTIDFLVSRNGSFREQQRKEMSFKGSNLIKKTQGLSCTLRVERCANS
jgi:hypothetical protein